MLAPIQQLDKRFEALRPISQATRPERGWIRAIREALGMTTRQLGRRLGVTQARASYLENAETSGNITLKSLNRAAEALGCRVVYVLVPEKPLAVTLRARALLVAERQLSSVEHTMRLEAQGVSDKAARDETLEQRVAELLRRPNRLWDEP